MFNHAYVLEDGPDYEKCTPYTVVSANAAIGICFSQLRLRRWSRFWEVHTLHRQQCQRGMQTTLFNHTYVIEGGPDYEKYTLYIALSARAANDICLITLTS